MHTVDLLDRALRAIGSLGYQVRQEFLDGVGSGACEIRGQKWLFLDLASNDLDRLHVLAEVLAGEIAKQRPMALDPALTALIQSRLAA
jgi:hypothetical protein